MRRSAAAVSLLLSLCALTSCAGSGAGPAESGGPWAKTILAAEKTASSDFAKKVFSDGQITPAEYRESQTRWTSCMEDLGYEAQVLANPDGSVQYKTDSNKDNVDGEPAANDSCSQSSGLADIEVVYTAMLQNPQNIDQSDQIARCFVKHGVVDAPFSGDDYKKAMKDLATGGEPPWDMSSPDYFTCTSAPAG